MNTTRTMHHEQNSIRRFLKTPKGTAFTILAGLTLIASLRPEDHSGLVNALVAVVTGLIVDNVVAFLQKRKSFFSDGAIITGLIIADVLSHATPLYLVAATTIVALLSKHVLKVGRKPIFNPAAFGLLMAVWVFHTGESWWGSLALLPTWLTVVVIVVGILLTVKVNKFPQVAAFLGTYFTLLLVMAVLHVGLPSDTPADALRIPFVNTALFLSFFMLTDPPTSPAPYVQQIVFGILVAVVSTAIFAFIGGLTYLLVGLLVANLCKAVWARLFSRWNRTQKPRYTGYVSKLS